VFGGFLGSEVCFHRTGLSLYRVVLTETCLKKIWNGPGKEIVV
jgi:hypothetical protein